MANNQDLPTILRAALRAYEQARAVRLQADRQASAQKERATAEINAAEQSERARLETAQRGQRTLAEAEQARLGELAAAVTGLEEAARTALAQAGLAHIAGAPTAVDGAPAKARRGDAEVSDLFVQAQTGYVALREALYHLAAAQVAVGQGDAGRQTLQPLLADGASPFFPAASALQRESYLRPAREALAAQAWKTVRAALAPWLKENKGDEEARELERQSYLRPAREALAAQAWETVRATLAPWLKENKADEEARELERQSYLRPAQQALDAGQGDAARQTLQPLLADGASPFFPAAAALRRESYLRPAREALAAQAWETVRAALAPWLKENKADEEASKLERQSYLRSAQQALEAGQWEAVRTTLEPWLKQNKGDAEAQELVPESYYRAGMQAYEARQFDQAFIQFQSLALLVNEYKDVNSLLQGSLDNLPGRTTPKIPGLKFVGVPPGRFLYGDGKTVLNIEEFWIAVTPITNAMYKLYKSDWTIPAGKENHPVVNVSWDDAQAFCGWAGVRLPTEQQWEKAARGTDGRTYPWGNQAPSGDLCNFNNIVGGTTPVGHYPKGASPYGLLDMAGNVWEWCENAHEQGGRVIRGGAYNADASWVGCAYRDGVGLSGRSEGYGFRVVRP